MCDKVGQCEIQYNTTVMCNEIMLCPTFMCYLGFPNTLVDCHIYILYIYYIYIYIIYIYIYYIYAGVCL